MFGGAGGAALRWCPGPLPIFSPYTKQDLLIVSMLQNFLVGLRASLAALLLVWTIGVKCSVVEYDMVLTSELRAPDGF